MRIVAGQYGGRRLQSPADDRIRPTSDKVRGAIFNALLSRLDIEGAHVLDLFCGSGALGLEALSRGAAHVRFVDKSRQSLQLAKHNAASLGVPEGAMHFAQLDAAQLLMNKFDQRADLAFLDPPYDRGLIGPALLGLHQGGWLADEAWVVSESESDYNIDRDLDYLRPHFMVEDEKLYGTSKIIYYSYSNL